MTDRGRANYTDVYLVDFDNLVLKKFKEGGEKGDIKSKSISLADMNKLKDLSKKAVSRDKIGEGSFVVDQNFTLVLYENNNTNSTEIT
jgi:hypothetical protein